MDGQYFDDLGKLYLVHLTFDVLNHLKHLFYNTNQKREDKMRIAQAIAAIQLAVIESKKYVENVGYETNEELVKLWQEAFQKTVAAKADKSLAESLYYKAEFWGTPQDWLSNPQALNLVPKFNELREECKMLLIEMNNK